MYEKFSKKIPIKNWVQICTVSEYGVTLSSYLIHSMSQSAYHRLSRARWRASSSFQTLNRISKCMINIRLAAENKNSCRRPWRACRNCYILCRHEKIAQQGFWVSANRSFVVVEFVTISVYNDTRTIAHFSSAANCYRAIETDQQMFYQIPKYKAERAVETQSQIKNL